VKFLRKFSVTLIIAKKASVFKFDALEFL